MTSDETSLNSFWGGIIHFFSGVLGFRFWVLGRIFFIFGCTVVAACWLTGGGRWLLVDDGARMTAAGGGRWLLFLIDDDDGARSLGPGVPGAAVGLGAGAAGAAELLNWLNYIFYSHIPFPSFRGFNVICLFMTTVLYF